MPPRDQALADALKRIAEIAEAEAAMLKRAGEKQGMARVVAAIARAALRAKP
jgi:hypothetical protein